MVVVVVVVEGVVVMVEGVAVPQQGQLPGHSLS
jgi:hypothetical protein